MNAKKMTMMAAVVAMAGIMTAGQAHAMAAVPSLLLGTRALNVSGMLGDNGDDIEMSIQGKYGYFYQDFTEIGAFLGLELVGSDYKAVNAGVFGEYNIDLDTQIVPYVGASAGLMWMDWDGDSDMAIEVTGYGGARYFFVDYAAIGAELAVKLATEDMYNRGQDAIDWAINLNTSFYF